MRGRLLSLAAAAAVCMLAMPSMEARASAAANVPALKSDSSAVTQVRSHRHYRGGRHFRGHRVYRHRSFRPRVAFGHRYVGPRRIHRHHRYHRRYRGPRFAVYGIPRYYGYYGYYGYRRSCGWLHRRAINTGSRYWWKRYRACRRGW